MTTKPVDGPVEDMSFDLAFDEAAADPAPVVADAAPAPIVDQEPDPAPVEDPKPADPPPADPAAEWKAKNAELERQLAEAKKVVPPPPAAPAPAAEPEVNKEEVEALAEFKKDWPNVQAATEIMIKQSMAALTASLKAEIAAQMQAVQGAVAPAVQAAEASQLESFRAAVLKVHPDAMTLFPQVESWVDKQPARLKAGYSEVIEKGNSTEFAELISMFKAATGVKTTAAAPAPVVDTGKEDRLQRMEGVKRARTGASAEIDENDFDGAFEAASRAK